MSQSLFTTLVLVVFFAPLVPLIVVGLQAYLKWFRLNTDDYDKMWRWISFSEPETGQQKHLTKGRKQSMLWGLFRVESAEVCYFRLHSSTTPLGTIGRITWDGQEIHVEGRISRWTLAFPVLIGLWLGLTVLAVYLFSGEPIEWRRVGIVVLKMPTLVSVVCSLSLLFASLIERIFFKRAYRDLKTRIWQ